MGRINHEDEVCEQHFAGWGAKVTGGSDATEVKPGVQDFALTFDDTGDTSYRALEYVEQGTAIRARRGLLATGCKLQRV